MSQRERRHDERLEQVARVLRMLPEEQVEVIALRIFGGMSAAQVGRIMGKNEAAVTRLLHHAVRELRRQLMWHEAKG
jgi:RNA polymerase sigma-70 factor (ECF subfamily)